jgi:hypothetical protein
MTKRRDLANELTEGLDALAEQRAGKRPLRTHAVKSRDAYLHAPATAPKITVSNGGARHAVSKVKQTSAIAKSPDDLTELVQRGV